MSRKKEKQIEQYDHADKARMNNPPVGLVTSENDPDTGKKSRPRCYREGHRSRVQLSTIPQV